MGEGLPGRTVGGQKHRLWKPAVVLWKLSKVGEGGVDTKSEVESLSSEGLESQYFRL